MKIIFLNAWEGTVDQIKDFIIDQSQDIDIFCLQESVKNRSFEFFKSLLPDFNCQTGQKFINDNDKFDQATFFKKNIIVTDFQIIAPDDITIGLGLYAKINTANSFFHLCNFHGCARPGDKKDTPARLLQSQIIIDFFKNLSGPKIIGGDFNLDLNIKSVELFKQNGYRNLIEEFKISTTRNHLAWDRFPGVKQFFADQLFVSSDVKVKKFTVPNIDISDHLPMILEIDF